MLLKQSIQIERFEIPCTKNEAYWKRGMQGRSVFVDSREGINSYQERFNLYGRWHGWETVAISFKKYIKLERKCYYIREVRQGRCTGFANPQWYYINGNIHDSPFDKRKLSSKLYED